MKLILLDRFDNKYGEGTYGLLVRMFKDPLVSLSNVGDYFGFTKQRASVYFSDIFGIDYLNCFPRERPPHRMRPNIHRYVLPVYIDGLDLLKKNKFFPRLISYKSTNRIIVNLFVIACCRFYRAKDGKTAHLMFTPGRRSKSKVDFYLCVLEGTGGYLIPHEDMPRGGISVSVKKGGRSKYVKYLNNFEPLSK